MPGPGFPYTHLSASQVLQQSFDETKDRLRVDATATIESGTFNIILTHQEDSIRLGDGTNFITSTAVSGKNGLDVNVLNQIPISLPTDASLSAYPLEKGTVINTYNEVLSVASGITTTLTTYTVPSGRRGYLVVCEYSGENIATYVVNINGNPQDKKRTNYGTSLNAFTAFNSNSNTGVALNSGDVVTVTVIQNGTSVADYNARIVTILI